MTFELVAMLTWVALPLALCSGLTPASALSSVANFAAALIVAFLVVA